MGKSVGFPFLLLLFLRRDFADDVRVGALLDVEDGLAAGV